MDYSHLCHFFDCFFDVLAGGGDVLVDEVVVLDEVVVVLGELGFLDEIALLLKVKDMVPESVILLAFEDLGELVLKTVFFPDDLPLALGNVVLGVLLNHPVVVVDDLEVLNDLELVVSVLHEHCQPQALPGVLFALVIFALQA